jgi:hypothetical protein
LFREDLALKNKWWHRLLYILFIFAFIVCVISNIAIYSTSDIFTGGKVQQWKQVATLSERINTDVRPIGAIVGANEKLGDNDRTYVLNNSLDDYDRTILEDVYCSSQIYNDIGKIKSLRKVDNLYIRSMYGRKDVPLDLFSSYIKENDIKCLMLDAYSSDGSRATFLEPNKSFQDNWSFYKKSSFGTFLYFLEMILLVTFSSIAFFFIVAVLYYKVFIYIIYGSKK